MLGSGCQHGYSEPMAPWMCYSISPSVASLENCEYQDCLFHRVVVNTKLRDMQVAQWKSLA